MVPTIIWDIYFNWFLGAEAPDRRGTSYRWLKPTATLRTVTVVCIATKADGNKKSGTCLHIFPIIRKVQWNTFFCYRQLQLTGWGPPNPFFRDFSPGEGKGAKAPRPGGCFYRWLKPTATL